MRIKYDKDAYVVAKLISQDIHIAIPYDEASRHIESLSQKLPSPDSTVNEFISIVGELKYRWFGPVLIDNSGQKYRPIELNTALLSKLNPEIILLGRVDEIS